MALPFRDSPIRMVDKLSMVEVLLAVPMGVATSPLTTWTYTFFRRSSSAFVGIVMLSRTAAVPVIAAFWS